MVVPQAGDFFVSRTPGFTGWLIRWWTRSSYNHAGFFISPSQVVEAQGAGARLRDWTHYSGRCSDAPDAEVVTSAGMPGLALGPDQRMRAFVVGRAYVGTPYGWLDLLSIGLLQWGIRPRWVRARVRRSDRLICSELVDQCRLALGDHLFADGRLSQDVTPGDLAHLLGRH